MSMLIKQKGMLVCTKTCYDKLDIEHRQTLITAKLADGREGVDEKVEKLAEDDYGDLEF